MKLLSILSVFMLAGIGFMLFKNLREPVGLGVVDGKLAPLPTSPNAVSSYSEDAQSHVEALPFKGDIDQTLSLVKRAVADLPGVTILEERGDYVRAIARSCLLRFRDDVEVFLDGSSELVQFRSASRVGYSDMGANRDRYDAFRRAYVALASEGS